MDRALHQKSPSKGTLSIKSILSKYLVLRAFWNWWWLGEIQTCISTPETLLGWAEQKWLRYPVGSKWTFPSRNIWNAKLPELASAHKRSTPPQWVPRTKCHMHAQTKELLPSFIYILPGAHHIPHQRYMKTHCCLPWAAISLSSVTPPCGSGPGTSQASLSSLTKSFAWTKSLSCSQSSPNLTITMQPSGEKSIKYAFLLTQKTACPSHNAEGRTQVTKQFANVVIYYTDKLWAGREKVQL